MIQMFEQLLNSYRAIYKTKLEEITVKIMGLYDPTEPLSQIIEQLEKGEIFN